MVSKRATKKFRRERADELRILAAVLSESGLVKDRGPLESAASECAGQGGPSRWKYTVADLLIEVPSSHLSNHQNTYPCDITALSATMVIEVEGEIESTALDPFHKLVVDCRIATTHNDGVERISSWHLDRHPATSDLDANEVDCHFAHPRYHLQLGGRGMASADGFGGVCVLETPRLAHPPLEAILGVDFFLSNYASPMWLELSRRRTAARDEAKLRNEVSGRYEHLLKSAQRAFWRPYARGLGTIESSSTQAMEAGLLWPQLVAR